MLLAREQAQAEVRLRQGQLLVALKQVRVRRPRAMALLQEVPLA